MLLIFIVIYLYQTFNIYDMDLKQVNKVSTSISISEDILIRMDKACDQLGVKRSTFVEYSVEKELKKRKL